LIDASRRTQHRIMSETAAARLFVTGDLAPGAAVEIAPEQGHYLRNVLRLAAGQAVAVFNGRDGEFLGRIAEVGKRRCILAVEQQTRPQRAEPDLWLLFAPVKRARIDYLVEKAAELGVGALLPIRTERTIVERINAGRLQANAVEAAEQTERLTVPLVHPLRPLPAALADWPDGRILIACDERGTAPPIVEVLHSIAAAADGFPAAGAGVLIGPEGGFTETELDGLGKLPFVKSVGLGPRVLRADTAALAALAVVQAVLGDWRHRRVR
jgi:16S rRNA (uracil1498-N3)-methyltransferase